MNAKAFLQAGAREILRGIAYDLAIIYDAGKNSGGHLWTDAKKIEKRFSLCGYTSRQLSIFDAKLKFGRAVLRIEAFNRQFEHDDIDFISRDVARRNLRDLLVIYGRLSFCEIFGQENYATAIRLTT